MKPYICTTCGQGYMTSDSTTTRSKRCPLCQKQYMREYHREYNKKWEPKRKPKLLNNRGYNGTYYVLEGVSRLPGDAPLTRELQAAVKGDWLGIGALVEDDKGRRWTVEQWGERVVLR